MLANPSHVMDTAIEHCHFYPLRWSWQHQCIFHRTILANYTYGLFMLVTNQCNHLISSTPTSLTTEFQFKTYWCRDVPPCTNPLSITIPPCLTLKKLPYKLHYTTPKWSHALPIENVFWFLCMVSDKLVGLWRVLSRLSNLLSLIFTTHRPQNRCLLINCL